MSDLSILAQLELGNGLFLAAPGGDYERVWIRDNVYVAEGFEALGDWTTTRRIYWGLLNILHRHSWKIDWALWQRPRSGFEYIHPRYDVTGVEIADPWGFKQHDAIGILLEEQQLRRCFDHNVRLAMARVGRHSETAVNVSYGNWRCGIRLMTVARAG